MRKTFTIFILLILSIAIFSDAQPLRRLNSSSYNVNDGLLQSHVMDMAFDAAGFMWLSFETGLQRYDGHNFVNIPVQSGLPDNKYIAFSKSKNGLLWMFHSKGISVYNSITDKFTLVYKYVSKNVVPDVYPIDENEGIVYFYSADGMINGINETTLKIESRNKFPFTSYTADIGAIFKSSTLPSTREVAICFDRVNLVIWDLKNGAVAQMHHLQEANALSGDGFYLVSSSECLCFIGGQLKLYNFQKNSYTSFAKNVAKKQVVDVATFQRVNNSRILLSVNNDLYLFDLESMRPLEHFVNFQNQPFSHFAIQSIRFDDFGNIYLLTRNEGFVKLLASTFPISYYGSPQKESNFVACMEVDKKNNRVLAGALNGGLLVFDTLQQLQKHIIQLGDFQRPGPLTIAGIIHIKKDEYLLFPRFNSYCVLWNSSNGKMKKILLKTETANHQFKLNSSFSIAYYYSKVELDSTKDLIAIDENLYEVTLSLNTPEVRIIHQPYRTKGLCLYQNYILTGAGETLQFLNRNNYSVVKEIHVPDCGEIRCVITHDNFIYAGCNRGLFKLNADGKIISSISKANGLPDDYIYAIAIDSSENIWCSTNKGIVRIGINKSLLQLKKEDGLQENEFNTNVVDQEKDGELFFGGVNGINSFYPSQITSINDSPKVVLTNIKVNDEEIFKDSSIWNMQKLSLPYTSNNLYFEFTALGKRNPEQYLYQYKILDVDKNWIQNGEVRSARYLLLPGKYHFELYAGKLYNNNPKNIKTIEIIITPPFWQTWWFKMIVVIIAIAFILIPIWQYNRQLYIKKLREMQVQHEIQHERERISRDLHDNLGAYAAAISVNVSKVKDDTHGSKMMEELQHNSQAIVTQLNDTIWALNREAISLTAISDRFKIFLQKIQPSYQQIIFSIHEAIVIDINLSPANALHLFRIMQEAVNNAVRHSNCDHINISIESNSICEINITDDGDGIKNEAKKSSGNGLKNIKLRATEAGWDIKWEDQKPHGTKFLIGLKPDGIL